ncbi:MAG: hypothetical protein HY298_00080 [Verrucomicrobia bacterium]|nr:hypothetical protein [Verrucomicrobiota bacterium]
MRQPTTKDFAEYFQLALEVGLCRENDIEAWADKMIAESSASTPDWLLNLSIDKEASKRRLLDAVPGKSDLPTVWNLVLARLGLAARTKQFTGEQVVRILFRWVINQQVPKEHESAVYVLDDGFDGIKEGWYSLDKFKKDFEGFFKPFRTYESLVPQTNLQTSP